MRETVDRGDRINQALARLGDTYTQTLKPDPHIHGSVISHTHDTPNEEDLEKPVKQKAQTYSFQDAIPFSILPDLIEHCPDFERDCLALFDENCSVFIDELYSLIVFQPTEKIQGELHIPVTNFSEVTVRPQLVHRSVPSLLIDESLLYIQLIEPVHILDLNVTLHKPEFELSILKRYNIRVTPKYYQCKKTQSNPILNSDSSDSDSSDIDSSHIITDTLACKFPEIFSGREDDSNNKGDLTAREFTAKFKAYLQLKQITDVSSALAHLLTLTKGPANRYVTHLKATDYHSVDELLQDFQKNFDTQKSALTLKRDIQARKYSLKDSPLTFCSDVLDLCQKANIVDEEEIVTQMLLNLPVQISCIMSNMGLTDFSSARRALLNLEPLLRQAILDEYVAANKASLSESQIENTKPSILNANDTNANMSPRPSVGDMIPGHSYAPPANCQLCNSPQHNALNCEFYLNKQATQNKPNFRSASQRLVCFYCGKFNHYQKDCRQRLRDQMALTRQAPRFMAPPPATGRPYYPQQRQGYYRPRPPNFGPPNNSMPPRNSRPHLN